MAYVQERMFDVQATVAGTPLGTFDTFDGGTVDSDTDTYNAGGMADPEALPGVVKVENFTISRGYKPDRDAALIKSLKTKIGQQSSVGKQALNADKTKVQDGLETFDCILKSVSTPKHDSNSGQSVSMLVLEFTVNGLPV
jgi:C1A family cysteine protease